MASTTNLDLSKKSTKTTNRKPSIPVRQTKTSKIRTEIGNQLEFLKNNLQKLKETDAATSRSDITSSKESVKSDTFKKPISVNILNRKSVVSRSNDIISRTNSGLRPASSTIKNTVKSPPRSTKNTFIKSTHSESKLNIDQRNKVKHNLNKTVTNTTQHTTSVYLKDKNKTATIKSKSANNAPSKPANYAPNKSANYAPNKSANYAPSKSANYAPNKSVNYAPSKTSNMSKLDPKPAVIKKAQPTLKPTLKSRQSTLKNEKKTVQIQSPLRKSISAMHLKRVSIRDPTAAIFRSFSAVNISETIDENETLELPNFNTPMAKRRSVYNSTPMTIPKNKANLSPWSGCWSPTAQDLKRRLSVWMEKNGKPYNLFDHLRCFGMHYLPSQEENKENVKVQIPDKDSSYEDLKITITDVDKCDDISVAHDALCDLNELILEGYPVDQCEAWLDVIRTRFEEIEDRQEYWECMAAIDKARGSTKTTCNNDENNDSYIENLLQKFNVLNLTPSSCAYSKQRRSKSDLNDSNIFKSTAINFAVKESSKHEDKKFLVTPIKRSTRQSTAGRLTPGIIVCSTLDELDSSVRNSMHFRTNKALKK